MTSKIVNEDSRLSTILVKGNGGEILDIIGNRFEQHGDGCSGLAGVGRRDDEVATLLLHGGEGGSHLLINQEGALILANKA